KFGTLSGTTLNLTLLLLVTFSIVTGAAWWSLGKGWSSARAWSLAASAFNLLLFPIGTIAGIAGLIAFWRPRVVAEIGVSSRKRPTPIPGDGTNKYSGSILTVLQVAVLIVATRWWSRWGVSHGLPSLIFWTSILEVEAAIF